MSIEEVYLERDALRRLLNEINEDQPSERAWRVNQVIKPREPPAKQTRHRLRADQKRWKTWSKRLKARRSNGG